METFSLDPGVSDVPTIYRGAAVAIEEFAPGNFVYVDKHKLRSIRVLYPGGPGKPGPAKSDVEAAGRLEAFHFCSHCDEAVESGRNACPRCQGPLDEAVNVVFADAFEAEESILITAEEESRQRMVFDRREHLIAGSARQSRLYPYPLHPVELLSLAEILTTNWGPLEGKLGEGRRFWLCPNCGRHLPYEPRDAKRAKEVQKWRENHGRFCNGEPVPFVLAHRFQADCLILHLPGREDARPVGRRVLSPMVVTLAESLRAGSGRLLELEPEELGVFVRRSVAGSPMEQIVFYETVPGGAGYLEEMALRLPEVARAAQEVLYGHDCVKACYLCLKHYRNQQWHPLFDKDLIRDVLTTLACLDRVPCEEAPYGAGAERLAHMLEARRRMDAREELGRYPKGEIEEVLLAAMRRRNITDALRDYEIRDESGRLITVPDFAWPNVKVAVFCDGYAYHGDPESLELDAKKRNALQARGWIVLTFWGRSIMQSGETCVGQILEALGSRQRRRRRDAH